LEGILVDGSLEAIRVDMLPVVYRSEMLVKDELSRVSFILDHPSFPEVFDALLVA